MGGGILASGRGLAGALILGLAAFFVVVGPGPLDPTNIAWLSESDAATNYLGWAFFRSTPWGWPPAANPAYGMDIAGSIMMADANPLFALPFKLLSPLLPMPFQYFGLWLLLCFVLQAGFAYRIAAWATPHIEQRLAITALFLFAPVFLLRIATPATFHMTLGGQWQILAALSLYLSPDLPRRAIAWSALLACAVLTHPYLLAMVATLWIVDLFRAILEGGRPWRKILPEAAMAAIVAVATAMVSGVFWLQTVRDAAPRRMSVEWGFGVFKANLLSPFDSGGWSWLFPDIPTLPEQIEGFAFLGAGVLLLLIAALALMRRAAPHIRLTEAHVPLGLALLGLCLFAASDDVALGDRVVHIAWPDVFVRLGYLFRSSGRFTWPVVYCVMLAIVWLVARGSRRRLGSGLLIAGALIQIADTSAGWRSYAQTFARTGSSWPTRLVSPFWDQAGKRYRAVRLVVPQNRPPAYRDLSVWALRHGMTTDIVYLARHDASAFEAMRRRRDDEWRTGRLDRDTLWIVDPVSPGLLAHRGAGGGDFVGTVDGITVFAPGFGKPPAVKPSPSRR